MRCTKTVPPRNLSSIAFRNCLVVQFIITARVPQAADSRPGIVAADPENVANTNLVCCDFYRRFVEDFIGRTSAVAIIIGFLLI